MKLYETIGIKENTTISIIGSGGKTSCLFQLAEELKHSKKVLVTTTTKMRFPDESQFNLTFAKDIVSVQRFLSKCSLDNENMPCFIAGEGIAQDSKVSGISLGLINSIKKKGLFKFILNEADGALNKSLKFHDSYEPVIPATTDKIIYCVGIDCIGKPFRPEYVHRADLASKMLSIPIDTIIKPKHITKCVKYLLEREKRIFSGKETILLINKIVSDSDKSMAAEIAKQLQKSFDKIVVAALREKRWQLL